MRNFKSYLTEDIATGSLKKATTLILKYLRKKTGRGSMFHTAGVEAFKNSNGAGYGIRYYLPGAKIESVRFNWASIGAASSTNLASVCFWNGTTQGPNYHISFERDVSLVQVLPQIAEILKTGKIAVGRFATYPSDVPLKEDFNSEELSFLVEAVNPTDAFEGVVSILSSPGFTKHKVYKAWKFVGSKIFDELAAQNPSLIEKIGRKYHWQGTPKDVDKLLSQRDAVLSAIGSVRGAIRSGSSSERYSQDSQFDELEAQKEKLSYESLSFCVSNSSS